MAKAAGRWRLTAGKNDSTRLRSQVRSVPAKPCVTSARWVFRWAPPLRCSPPQSNLEIEGVIAEDPFANLREVSYDYAGLFITPLLGKTVFRPATMLAIHEMAKEGRFRPDDVSLEQAVASRSFPVLLICGTRDNRIPCRHAERIYRAARGSKDLWVVPDAGHAAALGHAPAEYEERMVNFFGKAFSN